MKEFAQILKESVLAQIKILEHYLQYIFFNFLSALLIILWSSYIEHIIDLAV